MGLSERLLRSRGLKIDLGLENRRKYLNLQPGNLSEPFVLGICELLILFLVRSGLVNKSDLLIPDLSLNPDYLVDIPAFTMTVLT